MHIQPLIHESRLLREALPPLPPRRVGARRRLEDETRLTAIEKVQHISRKAWMLRANRRGYPFSYALGLGVRASQSFGCTARRRCCLGTLAVRTPSGVAFATYRDGARHQHPRLYTTAVNVQVQMSQ